MSDLAEKLTPPRQSEGRARATLEQLEAMSGQLVTVDRNSKNIPTKLWRHPWRYISFESCDQTWELVGDGKYEKTEETVRRLPT